MIPAALALIGETDCEAIGDGLLRQPAAAVSSVALVVLGAVLALSTRGADARVYRLAFGALLAATGVGSVLYHGPQGALSHYLHDVTLVVTLGVLAVINAATTLRTAAAASAVVTVAVLAVRAVSAETTAFIVVVVGALLVATDLRARRRARFLRRPYVVAVVSAAAAALAFAAGRSGSPLCDPETWLQGHAVWHAFAGVALFAYFVATAPARVPGGAET